MPPGNCPVVHSKRDRGRQYSAVSVDLVVITSQLNTARLFVPLDLSTLIVFWLVVPVLGTMIL